MFNIRQEDREGRYRLVLQGELGVAGAEELEAAITRLCTAGALGWPSLRPSLPALRRALSGSQFS
jgi:hypothetical protein